MVTVSLSTASLLGSLGVTLGMSTHIAFPVSSGTILTLLHILWDKWLWRQRFGRLSIPRLLGVHDLNGVWHGDGISSFEDPNTGAKKRYTMDVRIRQTFSRIEVHAKTRESTSFSTMAGMCVDKAMPILRYAFENTPMNMADPTLQRHAGLIELRIESEARMAGDYFSGKHRVRHGELTLTRNKE